MPSYCNLQYCRDFHRQNEDHINDDDDDCDHRSTRATIFLDVKVGAVVKMLISFVEASETD